MTYNGKNEKNGFFRPFINPIVKLYAALNHYFKRNGHLFNIISVRAFSYSNNFLKLEYKSKLLNINFQEFVKIYMIKDAIINCKLNCVLKNNATIKNIKKPIIAESIKNNFYFNLLNRFSPSEFKNVKINRSINTTKDIYYFDILENKPNYFHFIIDNFINLLLFIENSNKNYIIVFNANIANYINDFMRLIPKVYNIKILPINKNLNFIGIKNNLIFSENLIYQKVSGFEFNNINKNKVNMINPQYRIYKYPNKYTSKKGQSVVINNLQNISSKNSFDNIDKFTKKLLAKKIIKKKKKENYYIIRKGGTGYKNRTIFNGDKLINFLKKKNFKIISFDNKSAKEQLELIINSNIVIGIHGANLANLVFKEKKGTLIEIFPYQSMREGFHPQYVAEQRNLNYFRLNSGQNKKGELIINYKKLNNILNSHFKK